MKLLARVLVVSSLILAAAPAALGAATELITVSSTGEQHYCSSPVCQGSIRGIFSADGRFVAFTSSCANLVPGDSNGREDVFVRDRHTGITERVSLSDSGEEARSGAHSYAMSPDARFVLLNSHSSNLVPDDSNAEGDVFLRDRQEGTTEIVSISSTGAQGNDASEGWSMSPDARFIAFSSFATNLVPDDTNGDWDVFLRDRQEGTTELMNVSTSGEHGNRESFWGFVSADGRFIAFSSQAFNLSPADPDWDYDVYVRDRLEGTTELISVSTLGVKGNGPSYVTSMTPDGRFVVFHSSADNLVPGDTNEGGGVFVRDRLESVTELISVTDQGAPGGGGSDAHISPDGRWVAFESRSDDLVPGHGGTIFLRDRLLATTEAIDLTSTGDSSGYSDHPRVTDDGRYVCFSTPDLAGVSWDTNGIHDLFVRDREGNPTFDDVPEIYWAFAEIEACSAADIVQGYGGRRYQPKLTVTRDQMAVYIARALAGGDDLVPDPTGSPTFTDVWTDHWAFKYAEYAAAADIVAGYPDGLYHPERAVDRGQMAVYIARSVVDPTGDDGLAGYVLPETPTFPDVEETFWSYLHIEYCAEHGIIQGYEDGLYHPFEEVNREQIAVYVARAFGLVP